MRGHSATDSADESAAPIDGSPEWDDTPDGDADPDTPTQTTPEAKDGAEVDSAAVAVPMQKRRRVTRACDECRRKKIKCDGKQPCTHCTVYSYECTYDQPSNRRRNAAPQYIEALEKRLKRMESLLHVVLPNADLNDPNLESTIKQASARHDSVVSTNGTTSNPVFPDLTKHVSGSSADGGMESQLESMMRSTGQLDLDEDGYWDYHGHSSGLSFMRRMREQFPGLLPGQKDPSGLVVMRPLSQIFESPTFEATKANADSPVEFHSPVFNANLPPRDVARGFVDMAVNDAAALLRVVHTPSVWKSFDRIYDVPPEKYTNEDNKFLPLLYSMLALGSLFSKEGDSIDTKGYDAAINQGFKYFRAARHLMDIADCRDLKAIQAILFMILFLQSSAKLSTCYSYIGVALRSALRMGLHRNFDANFNPIEREERKRVFWIIRKMDTYVGALLGLPHAMSDDDIDQEYPSAVDDEYITETEILPMPEGRVAVIEAANAHSDLCVVIAKIVKYVYPLKKKNQEPAEGRPLNSYTVSYAKIREIELELQAWMQKLPMGLRPGGEAPQGVIRVQQLLRMAYAHAQMMLYRPFLHYVSHTCKSRVVDKRSYACAAACVSVSRNIIHIVAEMKKRGLLCGAYWFTMYTCFFAVLSLVFFALENPENQTSQDVLRDAKEGKEVLAELAKRSMAADRCTLTLNLVFDQLPDRLKNIKRESMTGKKRRQQASSLPTPPTSSAVSQPVSVQRSNKSPPRSGDIQAQRVKGQGEIPRSADMASRQSHSPYGTPRSNSRDSSSTPVQSPHSGSNMSFPPRANTLQHPQVAALSHNHNTWNGLPLSPTVVTTFPDANVPLPDLTSMMFPSEDPFAYPNQPLTSFQPGLHNFDPKDFDFGAAFGSSEPMDGLSGHSNGVDIQNSGYNPPSSTFLPPNGMTGDADVQLFGPVPMYQMQGMKTNGVPMGFGNPYASSAGSVEGTMGGEQGFGPAEQGTRVEQHGMAGINLEELFGGGEWAGMYADGRMGGVGMQTNGMRY